MADASRPAAGQVAAEAQQCELDGGMRLAHFVELRLQDVQRSPQRLLVPRAGQEVEPGRIEPMDPRQLLGHLAGKRGAGGLQLRSLHDAPAHRLAGQALHRERLSPGHVRKMAVRPGYADTRCPGRLEDAELLGERERVAVDAASRGAAHEQRNRSARRFCVHRPGLHGRAASEEGRPRELGSGAEQLLDTRTQRNLDCLAGRRGTQRRCAFHFADHHPDHRAVPFVRPAGQVRRRSFERRLHRCYRAGRGARRGRPAAAFRPRVRAAAPASARADPPAERPAATSPPAAPAHN